KQPGFKTDLNNVAPNISVAWRPNVTPNISVAWRPNVQQGFLRTVLGDPETATIRAGYSIAYNRNGMAEFTGVFGANTGRTTNSNRNSTVGNLVLASDAATYGGNGWPLLFRQAERLGPPPTCPTGGGGPA